MIQFPNIFTANNLFVGVGVSFPPKKKKENLKNHSIIKTYLFLQPDTIQIRKC